MFVLLFSVQKGAVNLIIFDAQSIFKDHDGLGFLAALQMLVRLFHVFPQSVYVILQFDHGLAHSFGVELQGFVLFFELLDVGVLVFSSKLVHLSDQNRIFFLDASESSFSSQKETKVLCSQLFGLEAILGSRSPNLCTYTIFSHQHFHDLLGVCNLLEKLSVLCLELCIGHFLICHHLFIIHQFLSHIMFVANIFNFLRQI